MGARGWKAGALKFIVALVFCLGVVLGQAAYNYEADQRDETPVKTPVSEFTYINPESIFTIALLPGAVVHGLGHFYAKDMALSGALFVGELISVGVISYGFRLADSDLRSGAIGSIWRWDESKGATTIWGGLTLFMITWVVDILHAPRVAEDYN